jgi:PilZ domain-containing protein
VGPLFKNMTSIGHGGLKLKDMSLKPISFTDEANMTFDDSGWPPPRQSSQQHFDRISLMRVIPYAVTTAIEKFDEQKDEDHELPSLRILPGKEGKALSINISHGGLLLLMEGQPSLGDVLTIHVPTPTTHARTPTLAEVRWTRKLPFHTEMDNAMNHSLHFVGLRFLF